jgi:hypothetical protein
VYYRELSASRSSQETHHQDTGHSYSGSCWAYLLHRELQFFAWNRLVPYRWWPVGCVPDNRTEAWKDTKTIKCFRIVWGLGSTKHHKLQLTKALVKCWKIKNSLLLHY